MGITRLFLNFSTVFFKIRGNSLNKEKMIIPAERDIISRMEMGDRLVTDYEVVTIAEVLDVSVVWLLGKEE